MTTRTGIALILLAAVILGVAAWCNRPPAPKPIEITPTVAIVVTDPTRPPATSPTPTTTPVPEPTESVLGPTPTAAPPTPTQTATETATPTSTPEVTRVPIQRG